MKFVGALACALFGAVGAATIPSCWHYSFKPTAIVMKKDANSPCLMWDKSHLEWVEVVKKGHVPDPCLNALKSPVTEAQLSDKELVGELAPGEAHPSHRGFVPIAQQALDPHACTVAVRDSPRLGGGGHTIITAQTSTMTFTSTFTQTLTQTVTQSTAAGGEGAFVTLLIEGVDYTLLAARVTLRETMEMELKQAVAAGQAFSQEMVTVEMSSGSLLITFKITAAGNTDFNTLAQQLRLARDGIAQRAAAILRTIPGIAAITVGTLTVRVCGLDLTRGAALTTCAANIAPEPMGSMPATLNSAVRIGGVVAADGLLADFQGSAAQGPHPALMFGLGAATALALAVPLSKKGISHAALASTDVE